MTDDRQARLAALTEIVELRQRQEDAGLTAEEIAFRDAAGRYRTAHPGTDTLTAVHAVVQAMADGTADGIAAEDRAGMQAWAEGLRAEL